MADEKQPRDPDQAAKISQLIKTLHETHEELRQLIGDGVDTLLHPDGAIYMMPTAQADLTQSERIQRHFAEERAAILDSLPANIALLDESGAILAVNDKWREFAIANDYPGNPDMIGQNYISACSHALGEAAEETPKIEREIRAVLDGTRDKFTTQYPCHSPQQKRWFEMAVTPVRMGARSGAVVMHFDITDRIMADERARVYKARLERIVEQSNVGILVERDGKPLLANPGLAKMLGYDSPDNILAQADTLQLFDPGEHERLSGYAAARLTGGSAPDSYRVLANKTSTGTPMTLEASAFVINWDDGVATCSMFTDVTRQIANEEKVRQSERLQAVGQLTGGVAHDFNNLLTIVLGNAEVLSEELDDQYHLKSLAEMIANAAVRGAELTNRLLAFARKQPLEPKVLDVAHLIQGMDGLLRRTLPENIDIEIIRAGGLWQIEADAAQLESALLNIAVNARDAMPDGGALTIEVANAMLDDDYVATEPDVRPGQYVVIVVSDTGHGIPADVLNLVFEPFFTTKEVGKGSGLGLSMVFGFVKQSGGHIRVYSEVDEGTSVKMYFPRSRAKSEHAATDRAGRRITGGSETILVVEDDAAVREFVAAQLKGLGYHVLDASNGREALDILSQASIDLLFTDVVMPGGMGGHELANAARELLPGVKILFTSGYTENSIVHHGRLDQGVKLLSKPYRREQLATKIREVLDEVPPNSSGAS
ncbi:response regulator [Lutimaribacter sp. EGI FJ00015]|uniref:Response regulator n=1 Tax=Lutimaribacter degradans TaxID=2945989 RepID=A0ACC5ZZE8_9RHOB|nr:PAS domain-containing sensor histidine kinase [Lutimaribacter sp. EGI FJ00013]MCM2563738.1 response regulator [Lutimaribacter sp. EGI FJ00013]MCO0614923.1 response regulator [Lutimaribacter sp. EGI FJ00015]MCO0637596.1 response regulator [Lutimaribacter sp. EGI FJ00014]